MQIRHPGIFVTLDPGWQKSGIIIPDAQHWRWDRIRPAQQLPNLSLSRLYWYRDVTVLLPGWVVWKYKWFVLANLPIWLLASVRTINPPLGSGTNPLLPLTLTTITSMQIQDKQASRPLHVHTTMQPPSQMLYVKCRYSSQYQSVK